VATGYGANSSDSNMHNAARTRTNILWQRLLRFNSRMRRHHAECWHMHTVVGPCSDRGRHKRPSWTYTRHCPSCWDYGNDDCYERRDRDHNSLLRSSPTNW
jgi:hypothetical protein